MVSRTASTSDEGIPEFQLLHARHIETLNLDVQEYRHIVTGASHYHLKAENVENVFMVAVRTVPMDSTGVAHILEHLALCGSERFPVRDPFFLMIRRSLNTFMNAFTTSDYTAYPFASLNRKDFFNLMDIYLDAVFFSRLDKLDFAQEGHRLEFEDPKDSSTALVYKGVVYNEMKGDSSSPVSVLYTELQKHLFPSSTYHYSSGGDPKHIPELEYDRLLDFYQSHYHPGNAVFMTFGDIPVAELQQTIQDKALHRFDSGCAAIRVNPEQRISETLRVSAPYALDQDESTGKTHIVLSWLLGENTDFEMLLKCNILSDVLLDTSASPLRKALEEFEFSAAASPLCGLEETNHEMSFMCGVEGSDPEHADAVEALILDVLQTIADDGVEISRLEAVFHQLELSQREVGGDGMPYGLQLIFSCMSAAIHRGNPIDLLDLDPVIEKLRSEISDPNFIKDLAKELLLANKHRVRLVMYPDSELSQRETQAEITKLEQIKSAMSEDEKNDLIDQAIALEERQQQEEDLSVLPKVGLADVPESMEAPQSECLSDPQCGKQTTIFRTPTNGIVYQQIVTSIPRLSPELLRLLPLYSRIVTEIGSSGRGYLETQMLQHEQTGGLSAFSSIRAKQEDTETFGAFFTLGSRTLKSKSAQMMDLLLETAESARFDEHDRVRDLVRQTRIRREANIAGNGHTYAMTAASSCLRPVPWINHELTGLAAVAHLKQLDDSLDDPGGLEAFCSQLEVIRDTLFQSSRQFLLVSEEHDMDTMVEALDSVWARKSSKVRGDSLSVNFSPHAADQAFLTSTPVNYCAKVYATVPETHDDSAALSVLASVLRNGYLHQVIREQGGAYGGGASHDSSNGLFRFYSYRDPLLQETFAAFDQSIDWMLTSQVGFDLVEEAILGIVSSIDAPGSPAGEARQAFHSALHGRGAIEKRELRRRILDVNEQDIRRVAEIYLQGSSRRALVTSEARRTDIDDQFSVTTV
ncbi:MAG: insulinase family protein [Pseudomonadales bacterium]